MDSLPVTTGSLLGLFVAGSLAGLLAHVGTPLAIAAARATGFLDTPGGSLKQHAAATPYLGGMAIFVAFLTTISLLFELDRAFLGILLASTLAALLGLMDDFGAMRPGVKLVGQAIIVLVLLRADVRIGIDVLPPWINLVLTAFWMLAIMNAVNFLDIMDGLAAADAASPELTQQIEAVRTVLREIGAGGIPEVLALNKIDRLSEHERARARARIDGKAVAISARTGEGLEDLMDRLEDALPRFPVDVMLLVPLARSIVSTSLVPAKAASATVPAVVNNSKSVPPLPSTVSDPL